MSSSQITSSNIASISQAVVLPTNKPVYFSYISATQIEQEEVIIKIFSISDVNGSYQEKLVGQATRTVNSQWKRIHSMFQKEFFMHGGRFKIQILTPSQELLSEKSFQVK